jgi:hypothetical protein
VDYRDSPFIATTSFSSFVVPAPGMEVSRNMELYGSQPSYVETTFFEEIIRIRRLDFGSVSIVVAGTIDNLRKMDS